ncbi:hypothetical protein [Burkholderia multivorans]|uniref:hypothetical protein n=1 Tax=Burkholderia multivorans TaxID=87883 RepID=UPI001C24C27C|nr:hypothetical protein [Burkholderia multivorans]MBU9553302.1 hypothetical protein [Burkholderia multivorans]
MAIIQRRIPVLPNATKRVALSGYETNQSPVIASRRTNRALQHGIAESRLN